MSKPRISLFAIALSLLLIFSTIAPPDSARASQADAARAATSTSEDQDDEKLYTPSRLTGPVRIDGIGDESAWSDIMPLEMTMYQPVFQGEMSERTVLRIGYDDDFLYVMASMYDSHPDGPLSGTLYRDGGSFADDYLNVVIDPFNDNENALWFYTTPSGIRGDMAITNDADGMNSMNSSWNAFWDVATTITDEGWFAEMRIPFSTLSFQSSAASTTMGIAVSRVISRKNERHVYPAIPPNWALGHAKPSMMQDIELTGIQGKRAVYITPYVASGLSNLPRLNEDQTGFLRSNDAKQDLGLDLRYNLTGNLVADVTVNTDFAQVEADDAQINLGRYSLFFPEKRQFFQEKAGIFDFALGFQDQLFHSRQIGLANGQPTRVFGGGRIVGRLADWDIGAMSLQTESATAGYSENFTILRTRKRVFNANSWAGGMLTSRVAEDGTYNVAFGLDGAFRISGDDYLTVRVAQSADDSLTPSLGAGFAENGFVQLRLRRRRENGFGYQAWFTRWEENFVPATGFHRLTDFTQGIGQLVYTWLPGQDSKWRSISSALFGNLSFANWDGALESGIWGSDTSFESKAGSELNLQILGHHDRLQEQLHFPDGASVAAGEHTYFESEISARSRQGRRYRIGGSIGLGQLFDGTNVNFGIFPIWNASKHFELTTAYLFNRVRFKDRDQGFDAHVLRVKAAVAANSKLSASAFVQYNSASDGLALNIRTRYNFKERNDLWVVLNDGINTNRRAFSPALPVSAGRVVLLKYTYTFTV